MVNRDGLERTRMSWRWVGMGLALLGLALAGCGGADGDRARTRVTRLQLDVRAQTATLRRGPSGQPRQIAPGDPGYVERLQVTVAAEDMPEPMQFSFELSESEQQTFSSRFEVPLGRGRTIGVKAFNGAETSIFHGSILVNLIEEESFCEPIASPASTAADPSADLICHITIPLERDALVPIDAVITDLENHSFVFDNVEPVGVPQTLSLGPRLLPADDRVPFVLATAEGAASGIFILAQSTCEMIVELSTLPSHLGPHAGDHIQLNPCQIDALDGRLIMTDSDTMAQLLSHPPTVLENQAPLLANPGEQTNFVDDTVDLQVVASDVNGDSLSFQVTGLPTGLQFDAATRRITGYLPRIATEDSPHGVVIAVSDGAIEVNVSFTWTVQLPVWGQFSWGEARWNSQYEQN